MHDAGPRQVGDLYAPSSAWRGASPNALERECVHRQLRLWVPRHRPHGIPRSRLDLAPSRVDRFRTSELIIGNIRFKTFDLGGHETARRLWNGCGPRIKIADAASVAVVAASPRRGDGDGNVHLGSKEEREEGSKEERETGRKGGTEEGREKRRKEM